MEELAPYGDGKYQPEVGPWDSSAKLWGHIQKLEATNRKLTYTLMQCIEILKTVKPPDDPKQWQEMISDYEKVVEG